MRSYGLSFVVFTLISTLYAPLAMAKKPDFNGIWHINNERSDDPREVITSVADKPKKGPGFFGRLGGSVGVNIGGIPVGNVPLKKPGSNQTKTVEKEDESEKNQRNIVAPVNQLTIFQDLSGLEVKYGNRDITLYQTGETFPQDMKSVKARWKRSAYVITLVPQEGPTTIERFELDKDGRLVWTLSLKPAKGKKTTYTRVYEVGDTKPSSQFSALAQ